VEFVEGDLLDADVFPATVVMLYDGVDAQRRALQHPDRSARQRGDSLGVEIVGEWWRQAP